MLQCHVASHMSTLSINDKRQNAYPMYVNTNNMKLGLSTFWKSPYLNGTSVKKKKRELPIVVPPRMCSRQSVRSNRSSVRRGILKNSQPDSGSEDSRLTKKKLKRSRSFSVKAEVDATKRVQFGENCKSTKDLQSEMKKLEAITNIADECNNVVLKSVELEPRPATAMGIEKASSLISIERTPCCQVTEAVQNKPTATNPSPDAPNRPPPPRTRILRRANTASAIIVSHPVSEASKPDPSSIKPSDSCTAIPWDLIQARPSNSFLSPTQIMANPEKPGDDISSEHLNETPQPNFSPPPKSTDNTSSKPPNGSQHSKFSDTPTPSDTKPPNGFLQSKRPFNRPKTCVTGHRAMISNHINFCDRDKTIRILKWLQDVDDVQLKEGKCREIIDDLQEHCNNQT